MRVAAGILRNAIRSSGRFRGHSWIGESIRSLGSVPTSSNCHVEADTAHHFDHVIKAAPEFNREFYKRDLPDSCIPFTSAEGKRLFAEALQDGTLECYFPLAAQFRTQDEPAYCGLTTLVMVLNTLSIDPRRLWKGPWRWFSEEMLDCCRPLVDIKERGIDLNVFMCLASCHSAAAELHRPPAAGTPLAGPTEADFRRTVAEMATRGADEFLILSYSRKGLGQTGDGHFSPMGGYNKRSDMLLVLDVARFKYMPHWVPVTTMWRAMQAIDTETGLPRGRLRTSFDQSLAAAKVAITSCTDNQQNAVEVFVRAFLHKSLDGTPLEEARCVDKLSKEHIQVAASLVVELENTSIYAEVLEALTKFEQERGKAIVADTVLLTTEGAAGPDTPSWKAAGCHTCGVSCIRVHKAHVLTLLILAFSLPHQTAHDSNAAATALCQASASVWRTASAVLQQEILLLSQQLQVAACALHE